MTAASRSLGTVSRMPRGFGVLLLALSFVVTVAAAACIGEGYRGIQTERLTHDSNAVRVQVVVDRVARRCRDDSGPNGVSRQVCGYDSYGHYRVGSTAEVDVRVLTGSRAPLGSRLTVLVDPADPRMVVRPGASGVGAILVGVVGVLMLVALALCWVLRRRELAARRGSYLTGSPK